MIGTKIKKKVYTENTNIIIKVILILIAIIIIIYYDKIFPKTNNKSINNNSSLENFITINEYKVNNDATPYPPTVYERAIMQHPEISKNSDLICNLLPILECTNRKRFPVHIIKLINGKYAAVFNDGKLYSTDSLKENMWIGPYENSMPDRYVPLRMITTTPEGNQLIGVGYDNKVYIKQSNKMLDFTVEWQAMLDIPSDQPVIYLMYYFDNTIGTTNIVIINDKGEIMMQNGKSGNFSRVSKTNKKLLKIFYDRNGYLLGLDNNFHLGTFDDKNWMQSGDFANKYPINDKTLLNDIIYDNDNKLIGISINLDEQDLVLVKQHGVGYEHKFYSLDNNDINNSISNKMTDYHIISCKLGMDKMLGLYDVKDSMSIMDNDINLAYQRQVVADNKKLREFCMNRQDTVENNFIDLKFNNQIKENENKISKIKSVLAELNVE